MQEFNKVKAKRVGAGITQEQMADALGMTKATYNAKENGSADWRLSEMNKFAEVISKATGQPCSAQEIFF